MRHGPIAEILVICLAVTIAGGCVFGFDPTVPEGNPAADVGAADADASAAQDGAADSGDGDASDAAVSDSGADVVAVIRCTDLDCATEGRVCEESSGEIPAECGDCLSTFVEEGDTCVAPTCRGDGDCTPNPVAGAWSDCGGYADVCATQGARTRLLYTGSCVSGTCRVMSTEQAELCPEPRVTDGVECVVERTLGLCDSGECVRVLPAPSSVVATDGTSPTSVQVAWTAVEGATGYRVYRDDSMVASVPASTLEFDDTGAPPGGVPEPLSMVSAEGATERVTVRWQALPVTGEPGARAIYSVSALSDVGEGLRSSGDEGYTAGLPLLGYEVLIDGNWLTAGLATSYVDTAAPAGALSVTSVNASDGTSTAHVVLSATVRSARGAARSYQVRARNASGAGAPSSSVTGQRTDGETSLQWQRSSDTTAAAFSNISGATTTPYNDTGAPSDGAVRHYRLIATASGVSSMTSSSESGYRGADEPEPGTLGARCDIDSECPADSWCSAVSGYNRCSPSLFSGQSHRMDFVYVPAGTFQQGTTGATSDERPYSATLSESYFVGRTEVSQGQWRAATGSINPSCFQGATGTSCSTANANNGGPVENVDWYSALAYANWLSAQEGLDACYSLAGCSNASTGWHDGKHSGCTGATFTGLGCSGYRLLTESEWERAARGGSTTTYYWGEGTGVSTAGEHAWFDLNSGNRTQTVGRKGQNNYGLLDMNGNVLEWVWDWVYSSSWAAYPSDSATDYLGPASGTYRGFRGGTWNGSATLLRAAYRNGNVPTLQDRTLGFRLTRTVP